MEIITKEGQKINKYTPSENQDTKSGKKGKKVGIAYELDKRRDYLCARIVIPLHLKLLPLLLENYK